MPQLNNQTVRTMTSRSRRLGIASLLLWGSSTMVWAFGPPSFADFDANGDGAVSEQEFNEFRAQRMGSRAVEGRPMRNAGQGPAFSDFDTDGNGSISPDELAAMQGSRMRGRGMGGGQMAEIPGGNNSQCIEPTLADMDTDKDGYISEEELYRFRGFRMSERGMQGFPMRNAGKAPLFEDIDTDGDKRISAEEFQKAQQSHQQ